jgi:hypothetical protein
MQFQIASRYASVFISYAILYGHAPLKPPMVEPAAARLPEWGTRQEPHTYWDDGNLVEVLDNKLRIESSTTGQVESIVAPANSISLHMTNRIPACLRMVDGKILFAKRYPNGKWDNFETSLNQPSSPNDLLGLPITLVGTASPDQFLGMNLIVGFGQAQEVSPCSWWKASGNGILEAERLIPIELDSPIFIPAPENEQRGGFMKLSPRYPGLIPFLEYPLRVPGAAVVVSMRSGILWVIQDKAQRPNVIKLLPEQFEGLARRVDHPFALYGIQPMPNGHILAALRSREALSGDGALPRPAAEVIWREIDPLTGSVTEPDPGLLGNAPRSLPWDRGLSFRFTAKGRLIHSS